MRLQESSCRLSWDPGQCAHRWGTPVECGWQPEPGAILALSSGSHQPIDLCGMDAQAAGLGGFSGFKSDAALRLGKSESRSLAARVAVQAATVSPKSLQLAAGILLWRARVPQSLYCLSSQDTWIGQTSRRCRNSRSCS